MKYSLLIATLFAATAAFAQSSDSKSDNKSDKLDIKKLEDKYWSAKDDDYSVVQNRAFTKEKRFFLYGSFNLPINDPYSTGQIYGLNAGYYFTEKWGLELSYMKANMKDNESTETFTKNNGTVPDHNRLTQMTSISGSFVPLYAKMSFLDRKIIYFDMGISAGLGQSTYEIVNDTGNKTNNSFHATISVFQHYFFSEHFAFRIDFKNYFTPEDKERYRVQGLSRDPKLSSGTVNDTILGAGVTYWF